MRIAVSVLALVACVHAGLWALARTQAAAPAFEGTLASVSYGSKPDESISAEQIRSDLKVLAPLTRAVRTYRAQQGMELVPRIADELGLRVMVGAWVEERAWIDPDPKEREKLQEQNMKEVRKAIELARTNPNVIGIVVGNETIHRANGRSAEDGKKAVEELAKLLQRVKRDVQVPVTTGETWDIWSKYPELARSVDFIAAHILPYWNARFEKGASDQEAVGYAIKKYEDLRQQFQGKRVVIAEFGWPSAGYNLKDANPGRLEQALVLREFVSRADALGVDYNIVEAIDQPWKYNEGSVGPYWGMFDAAREPKFAWTGPIADAAHWKLAAIAILVGFLLSLPILAIAGVTWGQAILLATSVHVVGAWSATVFGYWTGHYFVTGAAFALALGVLLLIPLVIVSLARIEEMAAIAFGAKPRRLLARASGQDEVLPKVSIHIPAYREAPDMLKQTLDAVARLEYPNFECVLVINNTPDPGMWLPVEEHCRSLGDRFKFVRADVLPGFKAGALRLALQNTAPDASVIGIIDADYAVDPLWLKDLVPAFADPRVGLVQAPQDHRDGGRSVMHHVMNGEYAGFFGMGMIQRNENNAIIVHGTMCLIRRTALEQAGGWSSDTICEDTDLGLSILERGWTAEYTNRRYGWGLLPDTYEAYRKQRHRWAYGGTQIVKKHWRYFLPGVSVLRKEQRRDFMVGWLNWLGAESVGVLVALFNLAWVPVVAFLGIAIPDKILTVPIVAVFVLSVLHFAAGYRLRVPIPLVQTIGAMFAAMSMQWTVAKAVGDGIVRDSLPFVRTAKGGMARRANEFQAFWEGIIGGLLIIGAIILVATNTAEVREIYIFAGVLVIQSLPFLSAVAMALLEGSRANDFAFWHGIERRVAELLPRRTMVAEAPAPVENRIESAQ